MNNKKIYLFIFFISFASFLKSQPHIDALKEEALKQIQRGHFGEAIDLLNKYISARPQEAEGYNLRGLSHEKRAQYEIAVYDFRSALKLSPNSREINENLKRTIKAWYSLLYNKIEGHKREIAINPNKPANYLEIGKSYKNLGEWLRAEEWYDQYLQREEASADEILRYTEILAKNNHISKGEPILKKYVEKYPDDHRLWSRYGYFTYWLGKRKIAIKAFENTLELRPYFKEAMDGLNMVLGKGYIYTLNDTSSRYYKYYGMAPRQTHKEYPIDRYYRLLRKDTSDIKSRYLLIDELLKVNRIEEALNQISILEKTERGKEEFEKNKRKVLEQRKKYYSGQIKKYQAKLEADPYDSEAVFALGRYYSFTGEFEKAMDLFNDYLQLKPDDIEARYQYALHANWNGEFSKAKEEIGKLLDKYPDSTKYQLLFGQLSIWLNEDLDKAEEELKKVLAEEPNNIQALIALGTLNFQQKQFVDAKYYAELSADIDAENIDVEMLKYMLSAQEKKEEEAAIYKLLERARNLAFNRKCLEAVKLYREYLDKASPEKIIYRELADAYVCAEQYQLAIALYDSLLKGEYNYDLDKQRAKIYFWSGDSVSALREFVRLAGKNPADPETKLYLGDSYLEMRQYDNARKVYNELLIASPESYILKTRLGWLPTSEGFPTYIMAAPEFIYFRDNLNFKYRLQGLRAEVGVLDFLSVGGSFYRGSLSSDTITQNLNMIRGHLLSRLGRIISVSAAYGKIILINNVNRNIYEFSLTAVDTNKYSLTASFNSMDAAQIIYSPFLVDERLRAEMFQLTGSYFAPSGFRFSGEYSFITLSDDNNGNNFEIKLGKAFDKEFIAGYEYYHSDYDTVSALYFSPQNYETHSIWLDWNLINQKDSRFTLGGKIGSISGSNFILREIYGEVSYIPIESLTLAGRISGGNSARDEAAYNFFSFNFQVFWSFY